MTMSEYCDDYDSDMTWEDVNYEANDDDGGSGAMGDEWYEEPEIAFYVVYLCKAKNGQLFTEEVIAWDDGVHIDSYYWTWHTQRRSLGWLTEAACRAAVIVGRGMKPDTSIEFPHVPDEDIWDDDYDDDDISDIPF